MIEKNEFAPERLKEVWVWKDSIYREVGRLPVKEGLKQILEKASEASKGFSLPGCGKGETDKHS